MPESSPALRRVPIQERSRRTLAALLTAAAEVFAETGFESATMEAVAARAGTSIGTLYRFFPNKTALFRAVAERNLEQSAALHDALLTPEALERPWPELIDAVVDGFDHLKRTDPGFRATALNLQLYGLYETEDDALHRGFVARTDEVLAAKAPALEAPIRRRVAAMITHVISAMLFFSERESPEAADELVAETKILLRRYLEPYLGRST